MSHPFLILPPSFSLPFSTLSLIFKAVTDIKFTLRLGLPMTLLPILCVFVYQIILYTPYKFKVACCQLKIKLFHAFRLQYMLATYCHVNCITINNTEHVLTSQCSIEGMMMGENALNNPHSKLQNSRCKSDFFPLHLQCEYICPVLC